MSGTLNSLSLSQFITAVAEQIGGNSLVTVGADLAAAESAESGAQAAETAAQTAAAAASASAAQAAMQEWLLVNVVDSSNTANAIVVTSSTGPTAPIDGMVLAIKVANTSNTACTINYNGTGAKPLTTGTGAALTPGALQASGEVLALYRASVPGYLLLARDGGNPQFASPLAIGQGGTGASTVSGALANLGLTGALVFAGTWNANSNTPNLSASPGTSGYVYLVTTAGTTSLGGISQWNVGDQAVYNGVTNSWIKVDGVSNEVVTVAGRTGNVVLSNTDISGLGTAATMNAGTANGVATLNSSGTVPWSQLPATLSEALFFAGTWNASTNTPALTSGAGTPGALYVVSAAGTTNLNGNNNWNVGDKAVYSGVTNTWYILNQDSVQVTSVAGRTGNVTLAVGDVANAAALNAQQTFTKTQCAGVQTLTYASTVTIDLTQDNDAQITLTGNITFANPSTTPAGASGAIEIIQDSTGGRTATWGSNWKFGSGGTPALSTAAGAVDVLTYHVTKSGRVVAGLITGVT